jgi:hypothetical protein
LYRSGVIVRPHKEIVYLQCAGHRPGKTWQLKSRISLFFSYMRQTERLMDLDSSGDSNLIM